MYSVNSRLFLLGSFRYYRDGDVVEWQWIDRGVVSLISNFHLGSERDLCVRHVKVKNENTCLSSKITVMF